jgi:hypothetical protein
MCERAPLPAILMGAPAIRRRASAHCRRLRMEKIATSEITRLYAESQSTTLLWGLQGGSRTTENWPLDEMPKVDQASKRSQLLIGLCVHRWFYAQRQFQDSKSVFN